MKIVTVLGARPQFIKAAPVSRALLKLSIQEIIVHTGQHFDHNMSQVFFDEMEIPVPAYNLEIQGLGHGAMTGRMLERIEEVLLKEKPDCVLVYGDTNSTLAGALAGAKLHVPIAHVEAGLRSFNTKMPEEINRILTDRMSSHLFCPTQTAVDNLNKEGFQNFNCNISLTGDVMYDAVLLYREKSRMYSSLIAELGMTKPFVLATLHRAENTNDPARLKAICGALNEINEDTPVLLPLHPRTKQFLAEQKIKLMFKTLDPVSYLQMLSLLENCSMVLTDSGGLQKEAYFFDKYCVTLRDQTEWVELVDAGVNSITGANSQRIISAFHQNKNQVIRMNKNLFGDGNASSIIVKELFQSMN